MTGFILSVCMKMAPLNGAQDDSFLLCDRDKRGIPTSFVPSFSKERKLKMFSLWLGGGEMSQRQELTAGLPVLFPDR